MYCLRRNFDHTWLNILSNMLYRHFSAYATNVVFIVTCKANIHNINVEMEMRLTILAKQMSYNMLKGVERRFIFI